MGGSSSDGKRNNGLIWNVWIFWHSRVYFDGMKLCWNKYSKFCLMAHKSLIDPLIIEFYILFSLRYFLHKQRWARGYSPLSRAQTFRFEVQATASSQPSLYPPPTQKLGIRQQRLKPGLLNPFNETMQDQTCDKASEAASWRKTCNDIFYCRKTRLVVMTKGCSSIPYSACAQ